MASTTTEVINLEDLRLQASELTLVVRSLETMFEQGAIILNRKDQVAHLRKLCSDILEKLKRIKSREMAASTGHSMAGLGSSLFRLGAGIITLTQQSSTMQAFSSQLLAKPTGIEPTFGTVCICIGPRGVPEDIDVVNISSLARESKKTEGEVIKGLFADGNHRLFTAEAFTSLIDKLAGEILGGRLSLPLTADKIPQK